MKAPLTIRWACLVLAIMALAAHAQLTEENVLVVYNDHDDLKTSHGYQVFTHYQTLRPAVHHLNLDDATLPAGRVSYTDYETRIRDKIQLFLSTNNLTTTVRVIVLTKGIPHQILNITQSYDLSLSFVSDLSDLPAMGKSLVIAALVGADLHIRIFDANGVQAIDKPETELASGQDLSDLKDFLSANPPPDESTISAEEVQTIIEWATSISGLPLSNPLIGNTGSGAFSQLKRDDATFASVDSELTLLWQDLDYDEAGSGMDSEADNWVKNPYYQSTSTLPVPGTIDVSGSLSFSSVDALNEDDEVVFRYWEIDGPGPDAGLIYLTARLDGDTVSDAKVLIDRSNSILLDRKSHTIILDETFSSNNSNFDGADYTDTATALSPTWSNVVHEQSGTFLIGELPNLVASYHSYHFNISHDPIALLSSFGANHPGGNHTNWVHTYNGQIPYGAIFNTYESFNGQQFGGQLAASAEHGQVADWVAIGGTFGIGHAWEPFTFAVAKNKTVANNFYNNGLTWVESAWSGILAISWQNTVVGDPLAKPTFIDVPQVTLSMTGPDYTQQVLEKAASAHTITLTAPMDGDLDINLSFLGATLSEDFTTCLTSYTSGTSTTVTIPDGQTQTSFTLSVLDDADNEGLEILAISVAESSLDTNHDGIGESYGSIYANASALIPIADSPFDWWRANKFGRPASPEADRDNDGLQNLWEYVLTSNPNLASTPGTTNALNALNATIQADEVVFELPKSLPPDSRLILETNTTLEPNSWGEVASRIGNTLWAVTAGANIEIDDTSPNHDKVTVTTTDSLRGFRRFRVEAIPSLTP